MLKELWLPLGLTVAFVTASFYQQELIVKLGIATAAQLRVIFPYALGIGIWMSLAYLVNRLLAILIWTPLSRRVPVPRLLRDVAALLIYGLAVMGIVSVVFSKPIGPFWAASGVGALNELKAPGRAKDLKVPALRPCAGFQHTRLSNEGSGGFQGDEGRWSWPGAVREWRDRFQAGDRKGFGG